MVYTGLRRLNIIKWLFDYNPSIFYKHLKLQKYLFFYEVFSKLKQADYSFDYLKGYEKGPVFSEVYGDYTYRWNDFIAMLKSLKIDDGVDQEIAEKANFLVSIMTAKELSEVTHYFDMWKSKRNRIFSAERQVELEERDFSTEDYAFAQQLYEMYTVDYIQSVDVIVVGPKRFLINKGTILSEQNQDTLQLLANESDLVNPVYVSVNNGVLEVD